MSDPRTPERQSPPGAALLSRPAPKPAIGNIESRLWAALVNVGLAAGESTVPPSVGSIPRCSLPQSGGNISWESSNRRSRLPREWFRIREAILRRDGYQCQLQLGGCSSAASEVDHRVHGDNHDPSNLQAACSSCHRKKSSSEGGRASASARRYRDSQKRRPAERHPGRRE